MEEPLHNQPDQLFRDLIESLTESPDKSVWANIEKQLNKEDAEKYKRKYIIFRGMAVTFLFLLLGIATFNLLTFHTVKNNLSADKFQSTKKDSSSFNKSNLNNYGAALKHDYKATGIPVMADRNKNKRFAGRSRLSLINNSAAPENYLPGNSKQLPNYSADNTHFSNLAPSEFAGRYTFIKAPVGVQVISAHNILLPVHANPIKLKSDKKANAPLKHFFISGFLAPEYANYTLENDQTNYYENKQVIQKREKHLFSYSAGMLFSYSVNKKFTLQSGLTWSSSNINIDPDKIYAEKDDAGNVKYRYNTSSGYGYILPSFNTYPVIGDSLYTRTSVHTLQFISIPVVARYKFNSKRFSLDAGVGISFNFLTKAALKTEVNDDTESELEFLTKLNGLKKLNYSALFTGELQYKVSERWALTAGPYLKYALAPINEGAVVKTYPYNLGLSIGMRYGL